MELGAGTDRPERAQQAVTGPLAATFTLSRLGSAVASELAAALEPLGLEPRQFGLLRTLLVSQGESQRAVGEALGLHPNKMVALVDDLEDRKLVRRRPHPSDRRAHTMVLTAAGRDLLRKAYAIAAAIETRLCRDLDEREREQLLKLLAKLRPADPMPAPHPKVLAALGPDLPA